MLARHQFPRLTKPAANDTHTPLTTWRRRHWVDANGRTLDSLVRFSVEICCGVIAVYAIWRFGRESCVGLLASRGQPGPHRPAGTDAPWVLGMIRTATPDMPASTDLLTAPGNQLPLIIYLHPSGLVSADSVLLTGLIDDTDDRSLGRRQPGFMVLAPEGRFTRHFYPSLDGKGLGWDTWYRQLQPASSGRAPGFEENVDAATIDHFVDYLVTDRLADPSRIFVTGWSNGGPWPFSMDSRDPSYALRPYIRRRIHSMPLEIHAPNVPL